MAGKCPEHLESSFVRDVLAGLTGAQLAQLYGRTTRTISEWKRKLRRAGKLPGTEAKPGPGAVFKESGNYARGSTTTEGPISEDEFIALLKVDTDIWRTEEWGCKGWQTGANVRTGHLEWNDSRMTGELHYHGLCKEDLWSTWATFVRRKPVAIKPVVQPVHCELAFPPPAQPCEGAPSGTRLGLLVPDIHVGYERDIRDGKLRPFHDRLAIDIVTQVIENLQPDTIVVLGDLIDVAMWTDKFIRSPQYYLTTQPTVFEAHYIVRRFREAAPAARIVLLEGNHEERIPKMLSVHIPDAYGLRPASKMELPPALSVPGLLALPELGIEWVGGYPDAVAWMGPLPCEHGSRTSQTPGGASAAIIKDTSQHCAYGHTHRIEMVSKRIRTHDSWRTVRVFSPGCLCHLGRVPGSKAGAGWQKGFALVDYDDTDYTATLVEIERGRCVLNGRIWQGVDYTDQLRQSWPDWNW